MVRLAEGEGGRRRRIDHFVALFGGLLKNLQFGSFYFHKMLRKIIIFYILQRHLFLFVGRNETSNARTFSNSTQIEKHRILEKKF